VEQFSDKDISRLDKPIRLRIDKALVEIRDGDPYGGTKSLDVPLRCKRSLRIGKFRVILTICEECMNKSNCRTANQCANLKHSRDDLLSLTLSAVVAFRHRRPCRMT